ncbi:MAG: cation transporter [Phycisphaerae bacterium]
MSTADGLNSVKLTIEITGMHCTACTDAVKAALAAVPAAREYTVEIGRASVTLDDSKTGQAEIITAIRAAGAFDIAGFSCDA